MCKYRTLIISTALQNNCFPGQSLNKSYNQDIAIIDIIAIYVKGKDVGKNNLTDFPKPTLDIKYFHTTLYEKQSMLFKNI